MKGEELIITIEEVISQNETDWGILVGFGEG